MQRPGFWKVAFLAAGLACTALPAGALITVGELDISSGGVTIAERDGLAYIGAERRGLVIADISNPSAPVEVGAIAYPGMRIRDIALSGGLAYLAVGSNKQPSSLRIVDISDPTAPVEIGVFEVPGQASGIAVVDHLAYLTVQSPQGLSLIAFDPPDVGPSSLRVFDVANPSTATQVGRVDFIGAPSEIQVVGDLAYIADSVGLRTIDVSEPTAPVEIDLAASSGEPNSLTIAGGLAYVAYHGPSRAPGGLSVFDLSDPKAPIEIGYVPLVYDAWDIAVEGGWAYLATERSGLWAIDVSNPEAPIARGRITTPFGAVAALAVADGIAYVIDTNIWTIELGSLQVIDLSTPTTPAEVSNLELRDRGSTVEVIGNLAYIVDGTGLLIIDVSDPAAPVELGAIETPGYAQDVSVVGSIAYVADTSSGLRIIDVSNPKTPVELSAIGGLGDADRVEAADGFAYVLDRYWGLRVIDVSDAEAPVEVGSIETPGIAEEFSVVGGLAYVAGYIDGYTSGLRIIDVSKPEQLIEIAALDSLGPTQDIAVSDGLAYLAGSYSGLHIIDVSNPERPVEIGAFDPYFHVLTVTVVNGIAYLGTRDTNGGSGNGAVIWAVDVSNPTAPVQIGAFDFNSSFLQVSGPAVVDSLVYAISYTGTRAATRLSIIDFGPEYAPKLDVAIDIKPGSDAGSINLASRGLIPVAILGSETFDVAKVDVTTLAFGPGAAAPSHDLTRPDSYQDHIRDVNADGYTDLVSHYRTQEAGISRDDAEACITGNLRDGTPFEGCDVIRLVSGNRRSRR